MSRKRDPHSEGIPIPPYGTQPIALPQEIHVCRGSTHNKDPPLQGGLQLGANGFYKSGCSRMVTNYINDTEATSR
jgi:hypothetical protein